MRCYLYDFDGTIYNGDSSIDFLKYILRRYPKTFFKIPIIVLGYIKYKLKIINKVKFKSIYFSFLRYIDLDEKIVNDFWNLNDHKIKEFWKKKQNHSKDIIVSASPEFLLNPIKNKYKVLNIIATKLETKTGTLIGNNCFGEEKVSRLVTEYPNLIVLEAYSDSMNDLPILLLAKKSFLVKKEKIEKLDLTDRRN